MPSVLIKDVTGALSDERRFSIPRFSLQSGDQVALLGKSGSGKSTVLNLLSGMLGVKEGSLCINGCELSGLSEAPRDKVRRDNIGMIFQTYQLLPEFTVMENVQLGAYFSNSTPENLPSDLLAKVGLNGYEQRYPKELSVGQQQRVAIARALIKSPPLILADEPTGALDQETGSSICDLLQELSQDLGSTLLFVTHDQQLAQRFPEQLQVSDILHWHTPEGGRA